MISSSSLFDEINSELWLDSDDEHDDSSNGIDEDVDGGLGIVESICLGRRLRRR